MRARTRRLELKAESYRSSYRWLEASRAYGRALEQARSENDTATTVVLERELGSCYLRRAFQSAAKAPFISSLHDAESAFLRSLEAAGSLGRQGQQQQQRLPLLQSAFSAQLNGYLCLVRSLRSTGARERQRLLRRSSTLQREALEKFGELAEAADWAPYAVLDYLEALTRELEMEWSPIRRRKIIAEAMETGSEAIRAETTPKEHRAWMHFYLGTHAHRQLYLLDDDAAAREKSKRLSIDHLTKAIELATQLDDRPLASRAHLSAISAIGYGERSPALFKEHLTASLESATTTGDNRLIADALAAAAYDLTWEMVSEEIPERRATSFEECKRLVGEAIRRYDAVGCAEGAAAAYGMSLVLAYYRASFGVGDRHARAALLEEAARTGQKAVTGFVRSGSIGFAGPLDNTPAQNLAFVLIQQANIASDQGKKRALFVRAARLSADVSRYRESFEPFNSWDRGIDLDTEASIQVELSRIGTSKEERAALLRAAAVREREAMRLCKLHFARSPGFPRIIAVSMGAISNRIYRAYHELYELTGEREARDATVAALREMAGLYEQADWPSRAAQARWRMGKLLLDDEGACSEASDEFEAASRLFDVAAKDIPQFGEYFTEYSHYMSAWAGISRARASTAAQRYEQASLEYASSSELLKGTRRWGDASDYFAAWGKLQAAEAHSARERFSEAIRAFGEARDLFSRSGPAPEHGPDLPIITVEERLDFSRHASIRKRYCEGRAALETARKFDVEEERSRSSSQYGAAASIFREIADGVDAGTEQGEFKSMSLLCQGWKLLKDGEINHSGALFAQAAQSFEGASRLRVTDRVAFVASANSHYCEAMRDGIEFGKTGDPTVYGKAKSHMEAARSGYADAELHRNALWTEAAMAILDARLYLFRGEATADPVEDGPVLRDDRDVASLGALAGRGRGIPVQDAPRGRGAHPVAAEIEGSPGPGADDICSPCLGAREPAPSPAHREGPWRLRFRWREPPGPAEAREAGRGRGYVRRPARCVQHGEPVGLAPQGRGAGLRRLEAGLCTGALSHRRGDIARHEAAPHPAPQDPVVPCLPSRREPGREGAVTAARVQGRRRAGQHPPDARHERERPAAVGLRVPGP